VTTSCVVGTGNTEWAVTETRVRVKRHQRTRCAPWPDGVLPQTTWSRFASSGSGSLGDEGCTSLCWGMRWRRPSSVRADMVVEMQKLCPRKKRRGRDIVRASSLLRQCSALRVPRESKIVEKSNQIQFPVSSHGPCRHSAGQ